MGACHCEGWLVSELCCVVHYTHFNHELVMCNGQHCTKYLKQLKRWVSILLNVGDRRQLVTISGMQWV